MIISSTWKPQSELSIVQDRDSPLPPASASGFSEDLIPFIYGISFPVLDLSWHSCNLWLLNTFCLWWFSRIDCLISFSPWYLWNGIRSSYYLIRNPEVVFIVNVIDHEPLSWFHSITLDLDNVLPIIEAVDWQGNWHHQKPFGMKYLALKLLVSHHPSYINSILKTLLAFATNIVHHGSLILPPCKMHYTGSCYCGAIKYTFDVLPSEARTSLCHCHNCKVLPLVTP